MAIPQHYLTSVLAITPAWLRAQGKTTLLIDLDNTLMPRDTRRVGADIKEWYDRMQAAGIKLCLVSNSWHHQCYDVAQYLGSDIVAKAIKPLPFAFLAALKKVGSTRRESVVVGDQLFTDVLGATLLGMTSIMVEPLVTYDLGHTLILRHVERWYLRGRSARDEL
ncbi:MAG: YqeG family HAD IIIA-type phosphatase [Coriobacteriia bacterium]|nr:YqeG family HAD IIIA-type phosphatase [Coriobacteriia bacterium]